MLPFGAQMATDSSLRLIMVRSLKSNLFRWSANPEDVIALLRDYHAAIGQIIVKYSGTLERFASDGVMVVFNDPVPVENPALQAVVMLLKLSPIRLSSRSLHATRIPLRVPLRRNSRGFWKRIPRSGRLSSRQPELKSTRFVGAGSYHSRSTSDIGLRPDIART